jgi:hypothetical protein
LFQVIVTREARATNLHPVRFLGFGRDEVAYETIKKSKFEPCKMADGAFIATIVPIEVTFRLYERIIVGQWMNPAGCKAQGKCCRCPD